MNAASMPFALEADNGSSSIFAPQAMGRLVQLATWNLAMHITLGAAI
jgi:hypothetical protein